MISSQHRMLSGRLKEAISRKHVTASAVAQAAGVDRGYVSLLKSGKRTNPSEEVVGRMAEYLDVNFEWLMTGNGPMEREVIQETHPDEYLMSRCDDYWDEKFVDFAGNWLLSHGTPELMMKVAGAIMESTDLEVADRLEMVSVIRRELARRGFQTSPELPMKMQEDE